MTGPTPGFSPVLGAPAAPPVTKPPASRPARAAWLPVTAAAVSDPDAPVVVRMPDGRIVHRQVSAARQRLMHLSLLHARTRGYVELGAGVRADGKLQIYTRRDRGHFLRGGASGDSDWLERTLALAAEHDRDGQELFVGVAPRSRQAAHKQHVLCTRYLWLDVDGAEHLDRLWALLERYPPSAVIDSAGSGGRHAYWLLDRLIPARVLTLDGRTLINPVDEIKKTPQQPDRVIGYRDRKTGELASARQRPIELIERYNQRLIHQLGYLADQQGEQIPVGDRMCSDRSRLMRLAGSTNYKTGNRARILTLDLHGRGYTPEELIGALPDPPGRPFIRRRTPWQEVRGVDPYKSIPAAEYFWRLAGIEVPSRGRVSCPAPEHPDVDPSCSVRDFVWKCHSCGHNGTIYDLASVVLGGPSGDTLASSREDFLRAVQLVRETFGERR
jgi:hypothetical protein